MGRFISDKTIKIDLSETEHVLIREEMTYQSFLEVVKPSIGEKGLDKMQLAMPLLKAIISGWNLKDDDGKDIECTQANIEKLSIKTVMEIMELATSHYLPEKKSS